VMYGMSLAMYGMSLAKYGFGLVMYDADKTCPQGQQGFRVRNGPVGDVRF
jgi:hypothetical protein